MSRPSTLVLGGHRGMGCTDHPFYAQSRDLDSLPPENSLRSFVQAYREGAAYVELDAVVLGDQEVVCLHNVVPTGHYFGRVVPHKPLNKLFSEELRDFQPGRPAGGHLARLDEALLIARSLAPEGRCPWKVNIELKGVQGSGQVSDVGRVVPNVLDCVVRSGLRPQDVLFSSFCLESLVQMAKRLPQAHYGMLFNETFEVLPIYANKQDLANHQYLPFTPEYVAVALTIFERDAAPKGARLSYLHPEFETCTPQMLEFARALKVGVNVWSYMEELDDSRLRQHARLAAAARDLQVPYTAITDYLAEMRSLEV